MRLKDADPVRTLNCLAELAQLAILVDDRPVAGAPVAVIAPRLEATYPRVRRGTGAGGGGGGAASEPARPSLGRYLPHVRVDLTVKDMSFRDVVAKLLEQVPSQEQMPRPVSIVVDESVSEDIRVTADLRKMSLGWVLESLLAQAGLTAAVEREEESAGPVPPGPIRESLLTVTIYIVPRPELRVSGGGPGS
jgi:hypothetical protein